MLREIFLKLHRSSQTIKEIIAFKHFLRLSHPLRHQSSHDKQAKANESLIVEKIFSATIKCCIIRSLFSISVLYGLPWLIE